jgi:hypothetical protein
MLAQVHWQAGDRPVSAPKVTVAGESALLVDLAEIRPPETSAPSAERWQAGRLASGTS